MSKSDITNGNGLLEARLAKSTLFKDHDPYLRVVPTASTAVPLGFFSFGLCGLLYMGLLTGWLPHESVYLVYSFFFTFAGVGELVVGLLEHRRKNIFASNAFLCYSFFWLGMALKGTLELAGIWKHSPKAEQINFAVWGIITVFFYAQTFTLYLALNLLFFFLSILLFCLAAMQTRPGMSESVGGLGVFVSILALYNGLAVLTKEMWGKEVVPMLHFDWVRIRSGLRRAKGRFGSAGSRHVSSEDVV